MILVKSSFWDKKRKVHNNFIIAILRLESYVEIQYYSIRCMSKSQSSYNSQHCTIENLLYWRVFYSLISVEKWNKKSRTQDMIQMNLNAFVCMVRIWTKKFKATAFQNDFYFRSIFIRQIFPPSKERYIIFSSILCNVLVC